MSGKDDVPGGGIGAMDCMIIRASHQVAYRER